MGKQVGKKNAKINTWQKDLKNNQDKGLKLVKLAGLQSQVHTLLDSFTTRCDLRVWSLIFTSLPDNYHNTRKKAKWIS